MAPGRSCRTGAGLSLTRKLPDKVRAQLPAYEYHNGMSQQFSSAFYAAGILLSAGVLK